MAVVCPVGCRVHSVASLAPGAAGRERRLSTARAVEAGRAQVVELQLSRPERQAVRAGRGKSGRFVVSMRSSGKSDKVRHSIPIER
jgi:hypothetical protein